MAFGVKVKTVKTQKEYTLEEFFEAIKDHPFTAGTPEIVKHGFVNIIAFPALDSHNQVQILRTGFNQSKPTAKWQIQKAEAAGMGNLAANAAKDILTDGLSGLRGVVGGNAKRCEQLVEETAKELEAMGL